jgi:isopenicillin-N N-acyltransferase-like protein
VTNAVPLITLEGSPHQRGLQCGRATADRIRDGLRFYERAFADAGVGPARIAELTTQMAAEIERYDPDMLAELEGIAEGARVSLGEVISLNARSELLRAAADGCTALACLPESTADGHTLLAQNWDWHPSRRATGVLLRIRPDRGPAMLAFAEAGALARCGLNEHGIGVVGNALECANGARRAGAPVAIMRRKLLMSRTLEDAVAIVRAGPRATSVNHLIASAEGAALSLETTPDEVMTVEPRGALLEHSNHFRAPAAQARIVDQGIERTPDTLLRDRRMRELLAARVPLGVVDVQEALGDHDGYPESICRHAETVDYRIWTTVASIIMDLDARRLWLAPGPVCENAYAEHALEGWRV